MNLRDIAETAVIVAWFGQIPSTELGRQSFLKEYWRTARLRCHVWHQDHIRYCQRGDRQASIALLEEVVVSELLTRVVVTLIARDNPGQCLMFGERVLEHEHKVKKMIVRQCYLSKQDIAERLRLERFQRRVERWIDLLLSPIDCDGGQPFAINQTRCFEFSQQAAFRNRLSSQSVELSVYLSSLRLMIPNRDVVIHTRRSVLRNMVNQSLEMIPDHSYDTHGIRPRLLTALHRS